MVVADRVIGFCNNAACVMLRSQAEVAKMTNTH